MFMKNFSSPPKKNPVLWWSPWMMTLGDMSKRHHCVCENSVSSPCLTSSTPAGALLLTCRRSLPEVAHESKTLPGTCCSHCLEYFSLILSLPQPLNIPFTPLSLTHPLDLKLNVTSSRKPSQNLWSAPRSPLTRPSWLLCLFFQTLEKTITY